MNKALQTKLGVAVRRCRNGLGISQEELAWRADMHRTYLADIERGGRNISLRSIANLAKALQVSIASLLAQAQSSAESESAGNPARWNGAGEIVLVEDTVTDAEMTLRAFKRAKLANPVRVIRDGAEALHYFFRTGRYTNRLGCLLPQLILLDLNLPKVSGLEVLRQLKAAQQTRDVLVVVLTASRQDRTIIECGRLGAADYIVKPVSFENLCKVTPNLSLHWALLGSS